ncbi:MAG: Na+/H+ antiporter [Anaerolineae bacterium]
MKENAEFTEGTIVLLLAAASLVAVGAKRLRIPYTIALVLAGTVLALLRITPVVRLEPHLILTLFLPALLFEAAYHLDFEDLRQNLQVVATLAVPGVLLSTVVVGALIVVGTSLLGQPLSWPAAFLFGALISATDPISVVALFREVGAPKRLSVILEGESLLNDGMAIVVYRILAGIALAGELDALGSVRQFFVVTLGGGVLGLVVGYLFSRIIHRIDDHLVEITLTAVMVYGVYLSAEALRESGVIAVVVAALVMGNYGARRGMSSTTRITLVSFWEYVAFLINSIIFLLIGMQAEFLAGAAAYPLLVVLAIGAVLLARALVVYPLSALTARLVEAMPASWGHILYWGGLRGSVSLALALGLSEAIPERSLLISLTFGYVFFSLVVQGLTVRPLLHRLGLGLRPKEREEYEQIRAQLLALRAGWEYLRTLREDGVLSGPVWEQLNHEFRLAGQQFSQGMERLCQEYGDLQAEELLATRQEVLRIQKATLQDLLHKGAIGEVAYRRLVAGLDEQLERLERGEAALAVPQPAAAVGAGQGNSHPEGRPPARAEGGPEGQG